jgi:hypothetical protein
VSRSILKLGTREQHLAEGAPRIAFGAPSRTRALREPIGVCREELAGFGDLSQARWASVELLKRRLHARWCVARSQQVVGGGVGLKLHEWIVEELQGLRGDGGLRSVRGDEAGIGGIE